MEQLIIDKMRSELFDTRLCKQDFEKYDVAQLQDTDEPFLWMVREHEFIMEQYSDDLLNERASDMAYEFNRNMGEYLNASDHKIYGNFNNIDYDYPAFRTGNVEYDFDIVNDMIARLNNQDMSEQSVKDRDFLVDWFFETFGTFGISYNFTNEISDTCYQYQQEKKDGSNNRNI